MNVSAIEYKNNQKHPFHLVDPSPWPLVASIGALGMTFGGVMYMHNYTGGGALFLTGFISTIFVMYTWWKDIVREGTYEGQHTKQVQQGLRWGMLLFIVSEIMFFFAFFLGFFPFQPLSYFRYRGCLAPRRNRGVKSMGSSFIEHGNSTFFWCNCHMGTPRNCCWF